ncbi:hypothetical protein KR018_011925 [Drosophila ironensis]|nr:hypothetical protein KR018_011925 [Drosophila ironensis]
MQQQHNQHRLHGTGTRTISQPAHQDQQQKQQEKQQQKQRKQKQPEPLPKQPVNTSRYKTELCRPFEETGECKYGAKCQFAHGNHELRNLKRHARYKTEYCRTFHSVGFCPYGPRCHFVHYADRSRAQEQAAQAAANKSSSRSQSESQSPVQPQQQQSQQESLPSKGSQAMMRTGSDRESSTGSLLLSSTKSVTNFPIHDALPQSAGYLGLIQGGGQGANSGVAGSSWSASSTSSNTSGLALSLGMAMCVGMGMGLGMGMGMGLSMGLGMGLSMESTGCAKQLLQKSVSAPPQPMQQEETPRLPVFNSLSSAVEAYQQQSNLGL